MKKFLGKALKIAGPALGGFVTGSQAGGAETGLAGAGAAVFGQLVAGGAKKDGKKRQRRAGLLSPQAIRAGHHRVSSPVAALSIPVLVSVLLSQIGIEMPEAQVAQLIGLITWASHALGHRAEQGA